MTDLPHGPRHPDLDEKEAARQRGEDPPDPVGHLRPPRPGADPDPGFMPDPGRAAVWRGLAAEIGHDQRPNREDVLPYLLIRAFSPGDRGQRPLWQPIVCWESPDILLIDASYTGPFDPSRLVISPIAGKAYRVFVRVWNLGLFPAVGVHVQAWAINPGFLGAGNQNDPYYRQNLIGGAWVDELTDRQQPGCTALVELDQPWRVPQTMSGHECLIASVTCPADHFTGPLQVNDHRHVGQRNLWVVAATASMEELTGQLGGLVPKGFTLELTHGGPAVGPLLHALTGNPRVAAPTLDQVRGGVPIGQSAHLLTVFEDGGRTVVARSSALWQTMSRTRFARPSLEGKGHPFAEPGGTRRLLNALGPDRWREVAEITDQPLRQALPRGIMRLLGTDNLTGRSVAQALGGPKNAHHLLRFTLSSPEGELVGGYSIVATATR